MKRLSLISLFFLLVIYSACAQTQPDAGMWNTFSVEKEFSKKFSVAVDEELRLKSNFTRLNLLYTNVGVIYRPIKGFKINLTYRLIEKYEAQGWFSYRNRLMLDLTYKYKVSGWSFSYRQRLQAEVRNYYSSTKGKIPEWFSRNKFEIKYDFGKIKPYIGTEFRYQFKDPRNPEANWGWHRIRSFAGVDYDINDTNSVGVYYLIQKEFNAPDPQNLYIVGLQYSLVIPHSK